MSFVSRLMIRKLQASSQNTHTVWRHIYNECQVAARVIPCQHCLLSHTRQLQTSTWLNIQHTQKTKPKKHHIKREKKKIIVHIRLNMTVKQLADGLKVSVDAVLESLTLAVGREFYVDGSDQIADEKLLKEVVRMHDATFQLQLKKVLREEITKKVEEDKNEDIQRQAAPDPSVLVSRPPIVTIMGHVDHGKTTLLDALRSSNVVAQEFGGITQHIGAFTVTMSTGAKITFLDTPGHAAFSAMRARGASVTDIIILVVAAEDGVMQQTLESIQHAKDANVPLIVAINKIDKPEANVEQVKYLLSQHEVISEDLGGDVQVVPISALKSTNLDKLQECIITQAEVMELKGDPVGKVEGSVVESRTDKGRGKLATVIIQRGTLRKGDLIIAGTTWARVRAMYNSQGGEVQEAPPSTPVEVSGWKDLPAVGDELLEVDIEKDLKTALNYRKEKLMEEKMTEDSKVIEHKRIKHNEEYLAIRNEKKQKVRRMSNILYLKKYKGILHKEFVDHRDKPSFPIVLKADVAGSVEAIMDTLSMFESDLCTLDIMEYGVGEVTDRDIQLAESFGGEIYAFNIATSANTISLKHTVPIKHHKVIYSLFDDLVESMTKKLPSKLQEEIVGEAKVLEVFTVTEKKKLVTVAGCRCEDGTLNRKMSVKIVRDDTVIYEGPFKSLKHHKNEVETIKAGVECGISVDQNVEFQPNDSIICFKLVEVKQELDWQPGYT